jgi:hypothetical protein
VCSCFSTAFVVAAAADDDDDEGVEAGGNEEASCASGTCVEEDTLNSKDTTVEAPFLFEEEA